MAKKSLILCDLGRTPICDLADNTPYSARNIVEEFSINEISSLSFDLPVVPNGKWLKLKNEMLVLFNDEYYKVKNITFKHDDGGKLYVSVECKHYSDNLSMDLISISEQTPVNVIALMKVALCYDENDQPTLGWKVGEVTVDRVAVRGLEALEQSPFSILLTIAEKFDGILKFNSQTMTVDMLERQSTTRPTLDLRVSKNLKNFSIKYDTSEMYTRLYCYGATDEDGITLDITSVNPTGKGYIDNFEYFKTIGYTEEFINSHPELFVSTNIWKDDNYYDPTDLYNDGLKELAKIAVPIVDVSISALDTKAIGLSDELTKLDLGACIRIYDEDLGVDTLCNVTKRKIDYEKPYILDATVTNSVTYHDTLSKLFTDVNTVSNVVTSGGSIIGGGGSGGGVSMDEVKEYLNVYYINAEQIEAKYAKIDELEANYVTSEYLKAHYIDAESIAAGYATIGQLHAIEAKIENLDVDYINGKLAEFEQLYADMAEFKDLVANSAEIDEIKAGELTVYGTLKATNAEVENLKATSITTGEFEAYKATIEQLFALYATIEYLEANYLKAQQIEATYAKITSLDAVSATINNLKVQVANVETLVAKKASIEDLNAVKANIETINAKLINVDKILADVITTDELKAEIAKINKLITDEINAVNATITSLDAKFATIEQLNADIANVKTLIADKANITDLEAAKADIGELEAQVANIDTILSGSIGTGTLQTIHLTAKNVVIDDAVISDLIAAKISVDQLKAGIISTNKFQVKSDDGGFKIVGNTTQWTDVSGKVRMQAGRDAEGNFNFAVFGEDGTTALYTENGVQKGGIANQVIVDDMVADNANIQSSKIQYVSNKGNQTLQTILDVQQGSIDALIKDTTIDGTSLKDKYTQLSATVDGLNVSIGDVQSDVGSINSKITQLELTTDGLTTSVSQAGTNAEEAKTIAQQAAEKFSWIVKSGTSETNFELTDRTAQLVADNINLNGLVTFSGLNSELQNHIDKGGTEHSSIVFSGKTSDKGVQLNKVVGKTVQQTTNGYQLFDASKLPTKSQGGATVTNNGDGSFTISGSGNLTESIPSLIADVTSEVLPLLKEGTIFCKFDKTSYPYCVFKLMNSSNTQILELNNYRETSSSLEITEDILSKTVKVYLQFYGMNGRIIRTGTIKPMLYQDGDGTWEPYTGGKPAPNPDYPMEIENVEISNIFSTNDYNTDDNVELNGAYLNDKGKELYDTVSWSISKYITIPSGFDKLISKGMSGGIPSICFYDKSKTFISGEAYNNRLNFDISIPENAKFFRFSSIISNRKNEHLFVSSYNYNAIETSLTLAEGDTYENGQITRVRKQITFDGSSDEAWGNIDSQNGYGRFYINLPNAPVLNTESIENVLSNIFEIKNNISYWNNPSENCISWIASSEKGRIGVVFDGATDLPSFKSWLSTHNLVVEYELETPTTEEFKVPTIPSYEDYTYVSTDSEVEPDTIIWKVLNSSGSTEATINAWNSSSVVGGTTQINGGYIQTNTINAEQLNVENIFSSGSSVMNIINAQEINANRITSGTINAKFLSVYGLRVLQKDTDLETLSITDQGDITMRGSVESYNYVAGKTGWSIRNDGDAEFNDVTVRGNVITNDGGIVSSGGTGRNLIKNSNFFGGTTYWQKGSNTTYAVEPDTTYGHVMKFSHTATGDISNNRIYFGTETFTHTAGVQYTLSFYVKADSACTVYAGWVRVCKPFEVGTQWIKVTSTYTPTDVGSLTFYCSLANTNVYIAMVKLEEGSVATAWSPAPEDNIKQVRFWAGTSYEQRENAPFKVYSDGSVEATQGTYSGVWTGDIRVGNISIIDPSSTSGGDASFTIRSGQNGINTVELTDIDHSTFRQSVYISDNANNTMISLGQNGSIVVNNSITVGKTKKVIIDDDSINIDGSTLSNVGNKLSVNAPAIDIGSIGSTTPIGINGNATVMGILKAVGEVNFNDVIVCKTSSNGIDFNFKE